MYTEAEVNELELYFRQHTLPDSIKIASHHKIDDLPHFIGSTLAIVRKYIGTNIDSHHFIKLGTIKMIMEGKVNIY